METFNSSTPSSASVDANETDGAIEFGGSLWNLNSDEFDSVLCRPRRKIKEAVYCIEDRVLEEYNDYSKVGGCNTHRMANVQRLFSDQLCQENYTSEIQCTDTTCQRSPSDCYNRLFGQKCSLFVKIVDEEGRGLGVMAITDIERDFFLGEYYGHIIDGKTAHAFRRHFLKDKSKGCYIMELGQSNRTRQRLHIDARDSDCMMKYVNHSCDPNCVVVQKQVDGLPRLGYLSHKRIRAGEYLSINYNTGASDVQSGEECRCQSSNCKGFF